MSIGRGKPAMTDRTHWEQHEAWHALFDAVCNARGHADPKGLAAQLCTALDKSTRSDFETACKNIGNWRLGRRTPRRRHFAAGPRSISKP